MESVVYEVNLYLNGRLIGNCRRLAQNLTWARRRAKVGADSIDFTINDVLFDEWCRQRNVTINDLLRPLALECRVVRNGVELVGGFLATMPGYSPLHQSANLALRFDGFLNLLGGVYIRNTETNLPLGTIEGKAGDLISRMIELANTISADAGKSYNLVRGEIDDLASITHTFDNYKTVKDWICDRCDNTTGAGKFDVYFDPDKKYNVYSDENFGDKITDWVAFYPVLQNGTSVTTISAQEVESFASAVFGLGAGEVAANSDENTAISAFVQNEGMTQEYGYYETLYQDSSVSQLDSLRANIEAELESISNPIWQPQITLSGTQVAPVPSGSRKIWVGDTIIINNSLDLTGMTNGDFRVNELSVSVSGSEAETITPTLERV